MIQQAVTVNNIKPVLKLNSWVLSGKGKILRKRAANHSQDISWHKRRPYSADRICTDLHI